MSTKYNTKDNDISFKYKYISNPLPEKQTGYLIIDDVFYPIDMSDYETLFNEDYWNAFTDKDGDVFDINIYQGNSGKIYVYLYQVFPNKETDYTDDNKISILNIEIK
jgi:hypothetical protein